MSDTVIMDAAQRVSLLRLNRLDVDTLVGQNLFPVDSYSAILVISLA